MELRTSKMFALALMTITLAACSSVPLDDKASTSAGGNQGQSANTSQILDPFNPQSILAQQRSVYFDYDSYSVYEQYRGLVETHARYLASNGAQAIKIEGNTDARGGAEYNIALGQRRADAVRRTMTLLGVADGQIETISLGKEKPKLLGNTESDFAENRRADIVYKR